MLREPNGRTRTAEGLGLRHQHRRCLEVRGQVRSCEEIRERKEEARQGREEVHARSPRKKSREEVQGCSEEVRQANDEAPRRGEELRQGSKVHHNKEVRHRLFICDLPDLKRRHLVPMKRLLAVRTNTVTGFELFDVGCATRILHFPFSSAKKIQSFLHFWAEFMRAAIHSRQRVPSPTTRHLSHRRRPHHKDQQANRTTYMYLCSMYVHATLGIDFLEAINLMTDTGWISLLNYPALCCTPAFTLPSSAGKQFLTCCTYISSYKFRHLLIFSQQ